MGGNSLDVSVRQTGFYHSGSNVLDGNENARELRVARGNGLYGNGAMQFVR